MLFIILWLLEHLFNKEEDRSGGVYKISETNNINYNKIDDKPNPKKRNHKKIQKRNERRSVKIKNYTQEISNQEGVLIFVRYHQHIKQKLY